METWHRIKCDVCDKWYEMFLPHSTDEIVRLLQDHDWTVEAWRESDRVHMHLTTPLVIGRVQCPACREANS